MRYCREIQKGLQKNFLTLHILVKRSKACDFLYIIAEISYMCLLRCTVFEAFVTEYRVHGSSTENSKVSSLCEYEVLESKWKMFA